VSSRSFTVLAIDPGSMKCGIVVATGPPPRLIDRAIVATVDAITSIGQFLRTHASVDVILIGDGTGSRGLAKAIRAAYADYRLDIVDEFGTSIAARTRYCRENPARGWKRILPRGLRTPEEPYDDYVALILAERWLQLHDEKQN